MEDAEGGVKLGALTWVGCSVTAAASVSATMALIGLKLIRTTKGLFASLFLLTLGLAEISFLTGIRYTDKTNLCSVVAFSQHYLILSSFAWLLNYSLYLAHEIRPTHKDNVSMQPAFYHFMGWLAPAAVVILSTVSRYQDYRRLDYCWITDRNYLYLSLLLPASFVVLLNVVVLIHFAVAIISRQKKLSQEVQARMKVMFAPIRASMLDCAILLPLLTVTWFSATFTVYDPSLYKQIIFCVSNCLLGVIIFTRLCFCSKDVRRARKGHKVSPYDNNNYCVPKSYTVPPKHSGKSTKVAPLPIKSLIEAPDDSEVQDIEAANEKSKILAGQEMKYVREDTQPCSSKSSETST